jgi:hypothetical protein
MFAVATRRHAAVTLCAAGLLGLGAFSSAADAAIASFEAKATVDLTLLDTVPSGVIAEYSTLLDRTGSSSLGALSSASSSPTHLPGSTAQTMAQYDGTFQQHADEGEANVSKAAGAPTGLADASSATDAYVYVENNSGGLVELAFEWAIDAEALTGLVDPDNALSASASAFVEVLIDVTGYDFDGTYFAETIQDLKLSASLDGALSAAFNDFAELTVSVPDGAYREITVLVSSGGSADAVPVPATTALLALGLLGMGAARGRRDA